MDYSNLSRPTTGDLPKEEGTTHSNLNLSLRLSMSNSRSRVQVEADLAWLVWLVVRS